MGASRRVVATSAAAAALAACGGAKGGTSGAADSLSSINYREVTEHVLRTDSTASHCPVTMRFEATLIVTHFEGKIRYVWERSDGKRSDTLETSIPDAARNGSADVKLTPDDWTDTQKGVDLMLNDRLHIFKPIEKTSPPVDVQVRCD